MENDQNLVHSLLPHRFPFLMVDTVESIDASSCVAWKSVTPEEWCFEGHFPGNPIFPGVLTIEALAQTCSICLSVDHLHVLPVFAGINNARFKKPVLPGDRLRLVAQLVSEEKGFHSFIAQASVDGLTVCEAELIILVRS